MKVLQGKELKQEEKLGLKGGVPLLHTFLDEYNGPFFSSCYLQRGKNVCDVLPLDFCVISK